MAPSFRFSRETRHLARESGLDPETPRGQEAKEEQSANSSRRVAKGAGTRISRISRTRYGAPRSQRDPAQVSRGRRDPGGKEVQFDVSDGDAPRRGALCIAVDPDRREGPTEGSALLLELSGRGALKAPPNKAQG